MHDRRDPGKEIVLVDRDFHPVLWPVTHRYLLDPADTELLDQLNAAGVPVLNVGDSFPRGTCTRRSAKEPRRGSGWTESRCFNPNERIMNDLPIDVRGQMTR